MKRAVFVAAAAAALVTAGQVSAADGKAIYDQFCGPCHLITPPKLADKAAFAPLIKQGVTATAAVVIKGKEGKIIPGLIMPPRGGAASDADVIAAIEYLFSVAK